MELRDPSALATPELVLSDSTSEQIDYQAAHEVAACQLFRVALQDLDPLLDIVFAKPGAKLLEGGYWYIIRRGDGQVPAFWKISDEDDQPCMPDERHLRRMHEIDSRRNGGYEAFNRGREQAKAKAEKQRLEQHREFREKLDERLAHLHRPQIFVPERFAEAAARAVTPSQEGGGASPAPHPTQE